MNGASLQDIATILGHKTLQMVQRYSHLTNEHVRRVVESMNENYLGEKNGKKRGQAHSTNSSDQME